MRMPLIVWACLTVAAGLITGMLIAALMVRSEDDHDERPLPPQQSRWIG